ncbi:MAG: hypothetical protein IKF59_12455, partial [Lachnospiraceae bacterium]|nr:hypothetical protein [Lachnospiraceae bacterium]
NVIVRRERAPCRCQRNWCVNESPVSAIVRWMKQRLDVVAAVTTAAGGGSSRLALREPAR